MLIILELSINLNFKIINYRKFATNKATIV